jgi:predicted ester cyclase
MSLEENKAIVRGFIEAYNKRNLDLIDNFVAPDYVDHTRPQIRGLASLKQLINMGLKGVPDWHETIEDIIAEGDKVWVRLAYTGTHTGEMFGLAPTGKKITATSVDIYRIVNGKLAEYWNVTDKLALFKPQGLIEYTEIGKQFFSEDVK